MPTTVNAASSSIAPVWRVEAGGVSEVLVVDDLDGGHLGGPVVGLVVLGPAVARCPLLLQLVADAEPAVVLVLVVADAQVVGRILDVALILADLVLLVVIPISVSSGSRSIPSVSPPIAAANAHTTTAARTEVRAAVLAMCSFMRCR